MKIVFSILLLINILFAAGVYYQSQQLDPVFKPAVNSEKIIHLPVLVECIEWGDFTQQQLQRAEAALNEQELKYLGLSRWRHLDHQEKYQYPRLERRLTSTAS